MKILNKKQNNFGSLLHSIVILQLAGTPVLQSKSKDINLNLTLNKKIDRDVFLITPLNSFLVMKVDEKYQLTLLSDSVVVIEGLRQDIGFKSEVIQIKKGQVYIQELETKDEVDQPNIQLKSDYFDLKLNEIKKASMLVSIDPIKSILKVCNTSSEMTLKLFDHEIVQKLTNLKSIEFHGVSDQKQNLQFDQLLEKRKIPKGHWQKITDCDLKEYESIQSQILKADQEKKNKIKKSELNKILEKKKQDQQYLCHEPYGNLDQCSYVLVQDKCLRKRCNAEGKWADVNEVSRTKNKCSAKAIVKICDY